MLDPDDLDGDLAQLYALYRAELDGLGLLGPRPAAPPRRRAARERPRRVARRAGLRVRLRGSDRRRVGAARGARRAHRGRRSRCPTSRARIAFASLAAHGRRPRGARLRQRRGAAAALERVPAPGARASRARALRRVATASAAARRGRAVPRRRGCARVARARRRRAARADPFGCPPRADRARRAVCRRLARAARDCARHARRPVRGRVARAARGDPDRARAASTPALRMGATPVVASCSRFCGARTPVSARSSVDYVEGRLRGRAIHTPARVEEEAEKLRDAPVPALAELRAAEDPVEAIRVQLRAMLRAAYGTEAPPAGEVSRLDLRAYGHVLQLLMELAAARADARRGDRGARAVRRATLVGGRGRPRRRPRPDAGTHAALRGRVRARPRGGNAAAALAHLAVPRRRPAARARCAPRTS